MYKEIIEKSGLTKYAAANKLNISYQLMNYYCNNNKTSYFDKIIFFMKELEVKEINFEINNCIIKIELK